MENHPRVFFTEPGGRRTGLLFLFFSFVCLLAWVGFGIASDGPHVLLVMGIAFALSGLAESLPAGRQRVAGVLRIVAVGILVGFIVLGASAPELLLG
jgi:hypothetical protein